MLAPNGVSESFLCLVLAEPKAPCYHAYLCVHNPCAYVRVCNSDFSHIHQQLKTTFEQYSFDFQGDMT